MFIDTLNIDTLNELSMTTGHSVFALTAFALLAVGVLITACSSQRYLLLFAVAGMFYWLTIEVLHAGLTQVFNLSSWHGYVIAMMLTGSPFVFRVMRKVYLDELGESGFGLFPKENKRMENSYIEHTPIYTNYQPKFQ